MHNFYSDCNLQANKFNVCQSQNGFTNFDGRIKGLFIAKANSVELFEDENCSGSSFSYSDDIGCFTKVGPNSFVNNGGSAIINLDSQSPR